ncbi:MaoC family dehydratase N-terminal domain-containing protein [Siccirubricoccus sp. KC 17139]|uniref:MaoC family dehydratase N-terminal domain-containing protein n=1 Tax=Siccirubricoccus soli TaxID=2899147 RepID=A0ABT1D471_9PROT|nr:MaoC family dehydratase N-terminal domain-containing protein [Siccirubricoccus soli]MCP2682141.1 MaoC family dehydratase N-terminal domain-containing protein [Siccirubricoccus soli]
MAIDYGRLKNRHFPDIEQSYTFKDTILYALGLGLGQDPLDRRQLRHVYEKDLVALPTMGVVLATPGFWVKEPDTGVDWPKVLHGEQGLTIHRPLPPEGRVIGRLRIDEIIDKGAGRGALLYSTREVLDAGTGELFCSLTSTSFLRGDGGFGGPAGPVRKPHPVPEAPPEAGFDWTLGRNAALLYRLNGDFNPVHADPDVAGSAGFAEPILHGLASYGVAAWSVANLLCDGQAERLRRFDLRFTSPVYPGETLRTEVWRLGEGAAAFRVRVPARDAVVLSNGRAEYVP